MQTTLLAHPAMISLYVPGSGTPAVIYPYECRVASKYVIYGMSIPYPIPQTPLHSLL